MSLRAEWNLRERLGLEGDPFERVVLSTGLQVDLRGDEAEVLAGVRRSLDVEGRLYDRGITCELKDGGQDCLTCPLYAADRREERRAPLCRLGRDQRLMDGRLRELREARFMQLAEEVDPFVQLGHLPEEYDELLTAAGL